MINGFPDTPGIYIAQRGASVTLIKITGHYPNLVLGKSIDITGWITGGGIKEVPKEELSHMVNCSLQWEFRLLPSIDTSVFPKTAFKPDGMVDLDPDTICSIRTRYFRMSQQGISYTDIMRTLSFDYEITMEQVRRLVNKFDKENAY